MIQKIKNTFVKIAQSWTLSLLATVGTLSAALIDNEPYSSKISILWVIPCVIWLCYAVWDNFRRSSTKN